MLREGLKLDEPGPVDRCLGCHHKIKDAKVNGKGVKVMEYDISNFMEQCVVAYANARKNVVPILARFDVLIFDEAHLEMPYVKRVFSTGAQRAIHWPRAVLMTGTRLLKDTWTEKHVGDAFLVQKVVSPHVVVGVDQIPRGHPCDW